MSVKLYSRASGELPNGTPLEISSVFSTQEEAQAQAVHDLQQNNRQYLPTRIEDEAGNILTDHTALEAAAAPVSAAPVAPAAPQA